MVKHFCVKFGDLPRFLMYLTGNTADTQTNDC